MYIDVEAETEEEAKRMFDDGELDYSLGRGHGEYTENTFNNIEEVNDDQI